MRLAGSLRRKDGFSFIELVMAMGIFVVAGLGTLGAYFGGHRLMEHGADRMRAVEDLQNMVERLDDVEFDDLQTLFPAGVIDGGAVNDYGVIVGGYTLPGEQIVVTYPGVMSGRLEVLVALSWTKHGRTYNLSTSLLRVAELEDD